MRLTTNEVLSIPLPPKRPALFDVTIFAKLDELSSKFLNEIEIYCKNTDIREISMRHYLRVKTYADFLEVLFLNDSEFDDEFSFPHSVYVKANDHLFSEQQVEFFAKCIERIFTGVELLCLLYTMRDYVKQNDLLNKSTRNIWQNFCIEVVNLCVNINEL